MITVATDYNPSEIYPEYEPELEIEEEESDNLPDSRPVYSQPNDWTVSTLRAKYERGSINLQPDFQREYIWGSKPELRSRLIESLLLQIPIPPLYFIRLETGESEVVDGQQRLTTLIQFIRNEFPLKKLQRLSSLNEKYFKDLPGLEQEKILDAPIRSIVIDSGKNQDLRYEIFERLNRGSMALKEQEIRNCVYRGLFCDLLAELEVDSDWRKVKGTETPDPRFAEREMILRFFAFANRLNFYKGNLKKFLNEYMGNYVPKDKEKISDLRKLFKQTMQNIYIVFGEYSGRLYTVSDGLSQNEGHWEKKFSISALDIQASALIGYSPNKIQVLASSIREAYKFYLVTNPQIRGAISSRTASTEATKTRWLGFKTIVHELFSDVGNVDLKNDPLFEAKALFRAGYFPAAGAIAGVVLERHLKYLCSAQNSPILVKNPTINPLNNALKAAQVYDGLQHNRIQVMGNIRNQCGHAGVEPPTKEDVWQLIEDVGKFLKSYPVK